MEMPSPLYEQVDRMTGTQYDKWCAKLGLGHPSVAYFGIHYTARIRRINELQLEGQGPGAYFERRMRQLREQQEGGRGAQR